MEVKFIQRINSRGPPLYTDISYMSSHFRNLKTIRDGMRYYNYYNQKFRIVSRNRVSFEIAIDILKKYNKITYPHCLDDFNDSIYSKEERVKYIHYINYFPQELIEKFVRYQPLKMLKQLLRIKLFHNAALRYLCKYHCYVFTNIRPISYTLQHIRRMKIRESNYISLAKDSSILVHSKDVVNNVLNGEFTNISEIISKFNLSIVFQAENIEYIINTRKSFTLENFQICIGLMKNLDNKDIALICICSLMSYRYEIFDYIKPTLLSDISPFIGHLHKIHELVKRHNIEIFRRLYSIIPNKVLLLELCISYKYIEGIQYIRKIDSIHTDELLSIAHVNNESELDTVVDCCDTLTHLLSRYRILHKSSKELRLRYLEKCRKTAELVKIAIFTYDTPDKMEKYLDDITIMNSEQIEDACNNALEHKYYENVKILMNWCIFHKCYDLHF